jgi:hypothetical protein
MRILFLDIDGVLNHDVDAEVDHGLLLRVHGQMRHFRRDDVKKRLKWLLPEAVARVNRILDVSGAKLVISSTWREHNTRDELQMLLEARGLTHKIFGMTPVLPKPAPGKEVERGVEIDAWLKMHPEVTSYAILDDGWVVPHREKHVWVHPLEALTDENVEKAVALLVA